MRCVKCRQNKTLDKFDFDYEYKNEICMKCKWIDEDEFNAALIEKKIIVKSPEIKEKKKKWYPVVFQKISKMLLKVARKEFGCVKCGSKEFLQVHHEDKNIQNNALYNLSVLCFYCHSQYHKHMQWKNPPKWLK